MRARGLILALALAACASADAPPVREDGALRPLTPAELRAVFAGGVACKGVDAVAGACRYVTRLVSMTDTEIHIEEQGVTAISEYAQGETHDFIVALPFFAAHQPLFAQLEARRLASGGFGYTRLVEQARATYDPATGAWCAAPDPERRAFKDVQFYFTAEPTTRTEGDVPFTPDEMEGLSAFMDGLFAAEELVARIGEDPEVTVIRDAAFGAIGMCATYYGVVRDGRPELRGVAFTTTDGRSAAYANNAMRIRPADEVLAINPD